MKRRGAPSLTDASAAVAVATACALGMGVVLAVISSPGDFKDRAAAAEGRTEQARGLLRSVRAGGAYDPQAVCEGAPEAQAQALRQGLSDFAAQSGLTLEAVDARPEDAADDAVRLAPVRLKFAASGSYESVVALLGKLSRQRPSLFVDTLDITSRTSSVNLAVSGRVFCAA